METGKLDMLGDYDDLVENCTIISKPLASKKLAKKIFKLVKKADKQRTFLRRGLKQVQAKIRKGERGLVVIAGDVSPINVICHLPAVCEKRSIPYCFVPTGRMLGTAMGVKRCTVAVLIRDHEDYADAFSEVTGEINLLPPPALFNSPLL